MYECQECSWLGTDEEVDNITTVETLEKEFTCPDCGAETDYFDGTEEDTIY